MKQLKNREEIAQALNFGKYPVLTIDLSERTEYGFKGCKVRIDIGKDYYEQAELFIYKDAKKLTTSSFGCSISSDFGYEDIKEMIDYANAPIIKPNQNVVLVIYDSEKRISYYPLIIRTGDSVRQFCSTPIDFEDNNFDWLFK